MTFKIAGIVESTMGPGGRDGYLHIEDAKALLRMEQKEISEVAVRVTNFNHMQAVAKRLRGALNIQRPNNHRGSETLESIADNDNKSTSKHHQNKPKFELHTWKFLSETDSGHRSAKIIRCF